MTVRLSASLVAAAICVVAGGGCGSDPVNAPKKREAVCDRGTVFSCYARGCNGHQFCNEDGSAMSPCTCDPAGAGGGGQAGSLASEPDAAVVSDASEADAIEH